MYRVLPLLLMIGLIAFAPLSLPAQDKDKDKDAKVDEKKGDEKKGDEKKGDEKPPEVPPTAKKTNTGEQELTVYRQLDYAEKAGQVMPFVTIILIVVLFILVLSLRSAVSQLEEKIKGGS